MNKMLYGLMSLIKNPPKAAVDNLQAENTTYKAPRGLVTITIAVRLS